MYIYIYILFWKVLHFSRRYCWCEKQKWLRSVKESRIFREFAEHRGVIIKSKSCLERKMIVIRRKVVPLLYAICPINSDQVKIRFAMQENNHKVIFSYLALIDMH